MPSAMFVTSHFSDVLTHARFSFHSCLKFSRIRILQLYPFIYASMSESAIPGLSYIPVDDPAAGIPIPGIKTDGFVPLSFVYGNCQPVTDLENIGIIHDGEYAKIFKCRDKKEKEGSNTYTLKKFKILSTESGIPCRILREIKHLRTLKHPNIVNYIRMVSDKGLDRNCMLLEYCEYSLKDFTEKNMPGIYAADSIKYVMKHLFEGLGYIHDAMVLHRNITASNILFDNMGMLKIAGFRMSRPYSNGDMTPEVTELTYRAPELLLGTKRYGPAVDMWSAGCIFAQLLLRKALFTGSSELMVFNSICDVLGTPSKSIWPGFDELFTITGDARPFSTLAQIFRGVPKSSFDLVSHLLVYYPVARLSSKTCLRNPYFKEPPEVCSPETFLQNLSCDVSMELDR